MIEVTYAANLTRPINIDATYVNIVRYEVEYGSEGETIGYKSFILRLEPFGWKEFKDFDMLEPTLSFSGISQMRQGHMTFDGSDEDHPGTLIE